MSNFDNATTYNYNSIFYFLLRPYHAATDHAKNRLHLNKAITLIHSLALEFCSLDLKENIPPSLMNEKTHI